MLENKRLRYNGKKYKRFYFAGEADLEKGKKYELIGIYHKTGKDYEGDVYVIDLDGIHQGFPMEWFEVLPIKVVYIGDNSKFSDGTITREVKKDTVCEFIDYVRFVSATESFDLIRAKHPAGFIFESYESCFEEPAIKK